MPTPEFAGVTADVTIILSAFGGIGGIGGLECWEIPPAYGAGHSIEPFQVFRCSRRKFLGSESFINVAKLVGKVGGLNVRTVGHFDGVGVDRSA